MFLTDLNRQQKCFCMHDMLSFLNEPIVLSQSDHGHLHLPRQLHILAQRQGLRQPPR